MVGSVRPDPHDRAGRDAGARAARGCARAADTRARVADQARLAPDDAHAARQARPAGLMTGERNGC